MTSLKQIGILAHPLRPQTAPVAERLEHVLRERGIETWLFTRWNEADVNAQAEQSDMVIAIGGDGAMLRAARVCAPFAVPVLGVNMGQLGFLTEISAPDASEQALDSVLAGDYWIEERMMLHVTALRGGLHLAEAQALNDVVVSRGVIARTIRLETYIDKGWATTYNADALIIATATGSTAYALACGGPILPPELRNILVVPVAPHLSMDRPMVLSEGSTVDVIASEDNQTEMSLAVDGVMVCDVEPGDKVQVSASEHISRFVRLRERTYFYRSLLDRLEPRIPIRSEPQVKQI